MLAKVTNSSDTCERVWSKNILKQPKQTWNSRFNGESYRQFKTKTNSFTGEHAWNTLTYEGWNVPKPYEYNTCLNCLYFLRNWCISWRLVFQYWPQQLFFRQKTIFLTMNNCQKWFTSSDNYQQIGIPYARDKTALLNRPPSWIERLLINELVK